MRMSITYIGFDMRPTTIMRLHFSIYTFDYTYFFWFIFVFAIKMHWPFFMLEQLERIKQTNHLHACCRVCSCFSIIFVFFFALSMFSSFGWLVLDDGTMQLHFPFTLHQSFISIKIISRASVTIMYR